MLKTASGSVEDLEVFKRAYALSLDIHRASLSLPVVEQYGLAPQMRRASKSICVNLAEGFAKWQASPAEFGRYVMIALGSADEMQIWCRYCVDLGYVSAEVVDAWRARYAEIAKMLQGLRKHLQL